MKTKIQTSTHIFYGWTIFNNETLRWGVLKLDNKIFAILNNYINILVSQQTPAIFYLQK